VIAVSKLSWEMVKGKCTFLSWATDRCHERVMLEVILLKVLCCCLGICTWCVFTRVLCHHQQYDSFIHIHIAEGDSHLEHCAVQYHRSKPTFQRCSLPPSSGCQRQQAPLKRCSTSMRLHNTVSQKAVIFIATTVRTWNLTYILLFNVFLFR
jgi:hypothetical protein